MLKASLQEQEAKLLSRRNKKEWTPGHATVSMQSKGDWKSTAERRKGQTTYGGKVSRQGAGLSAAQSADRESFSTDNSLCSELFFQNEDKIKSPSTNQKKKKKFTETKKEIQKAQVCPGQDKEICSRM